MVIGSSDQLEIVNSEQYLTENNPSFRFLQFIGENSSFLFLGTCHYYEFLHSSIHI